MLYCKKLLSRLWGGFFVVLLVAFIPFGLFWLLPDDSAASLEAGDALHEAGRLTIIDTLLESAIQNNLINGAVVQIGSSSQVLYTSAVGQTGFDDQSAAVQVDTLFDVASLTKVFATSAAIMRLVDQGALSLSEPVSRWFPELDQSKITILHLLTHTSGLRDASLDPKAPLKSVVRQAAKQAGKIPPGSNFRYADINFILLGNIVRRMTATDLDEYCRMVFYQPLKMESTGFNPSFSNNTAATLGGPTGVLQGVVQDYNARLLGGVAGHAGLFSTTQDLGRFSTMLLNGGWLDGHQVLSKQAVEQMTAPYYFKGGKVVRGLGWDRDTAYSAPKGEHFTDASYGHTGYSGSSVWIDPEKDLYVILLTTRKEYRDARSFNRLRSDISTVAAMLFAP